MKKLWTIFVALFMILTSLLMPVDAKAEDITVRADLTIDKIWIHAEDKQDVTFRISVEYGGNQYFLDEETIPSTSTQDTITIENIPLFINEDIPVFEIKNENGDKYSLDNQDDLSKIIEDFDNGLIFELDTEDVHFIIEEGTGTGNEFKPLEQFDPFVYSYLGSIGLDHDTNAIYLKVKNHVINDYPVQIEKYVDKAVHKNISYGQVVTYDILAYIPNDEIIDENGFIIEDQLSQYLQIVDNEVRVK